MEEQDIMNIWDIFLEFIPEKNRDAAAARYVTYLVNHDTDLDELESILGNDDHLDNAIEEVLEEHDNDHDEDDDDDDKDW